VFWNTIHYC